MRAFGILGGVLALAVSGEEVLPRGKFAGMRTKYLSLVSADTPNSTPYHDPVTGIDYQSYTETTTSITIRVALPTNVSAPYDAIVSVVTPLSNKWVGFCWGGTMPWNALTVSWANGKDAMVSSRFALYVTLVLF
jgi:hypothetical protein